MDPAFLHEPEEDIFRYRKHPRLFDWLFLFCVSCSFIFNLRAKWSGSSLSFSLLDLPIVVLLGMAIASFFRKRTLSIGKDSFSHETPQGKIEPIRFSKIGEIIESSHDLSIVHLVPKGLIRLNLLKSDFKSSEWSSVVALLTKRTEVEAPSARIDLKSSP